MRNSLVHTYQSESFAGSVGKDKTLVFTSPVYLRHYLGKFKEGDSLSISITNKRPKRTEQQNRYYHGVYLPLIAQETGEQDISMLHELFKGKFLTEKIVTVLGEPVRKKKSTAELSVSEFMEYITAIENFTQIQAPPVENFLTQD